MKSVFLGFLFAIAATCMTGCGGCKRKVSSSAPPPAQEEKESALAAKKEEAGKEEEETRAESIKDVYWSQAAGRFYPASASELGGMIDRYMKDASRIAELDALDIVGFISPHAGYVYSGPVAAWGYRQVQDRKISSVVVLGFNHGGSPALSSILPYRGYRTPLGTARVDEEARKLLLEKGKGVLQGSEIPFGGEHSIETQIPFIQKALPGASIVPIMVAHPGGKHDEKLAALLFEVLGGRMDVLFVASTDLSHYMPYDDAVATDRETLGWIAGLKWDRMEKEGTGTNRMCGYFTTGVLMKLFGMYDSPERKGSLVKYLNSGDTSGDRSRGVVGYGVVALSLPQGVRTLKGEKKKGQAEAGQALEATVEERESLQKVAREAIEAALSGRSYVAENRPEGIMERKTGSIVVVEIDGRIQGTGKDLSLTRSLRDAVAEAARSAVLDDPRYPTPPAEKIPVMKIGLFAVSETAHIDDPLAEEIGGSGLLVKSKWGEGVILPGEAEKNGWKREEALGHACRRANLPPDCWKGDARKRERVAFTALKGWAL